MAKWSKDELSRIAKTDNLHISPFREDGVTYGTPTCLHAVVRFGTQTWIWSVAVGTALYVRAYNEQKSSWYKAAIRQKAGRITAAGMTKKVNFEPVSGAINDQIDTAYLGKYKGNPYLSPMIGARARSATVKVIPRYNNG